MLQLRQGRTGAIKVSKPAVPSNIDTNVFKTKAAANRSPDNFVDEDVQPLSQVAVTTTLPATYPDIVPVKLIYSTVNADSINIRSDPEIYDHKNTDPNTNNLFSNKMGSISENRKCERCNEAKPKCPGHPGRITLHAMVYPSFAVQVIAAVLTCICQTCSFALGFESLKICKCQYCGKINNMAERSCSSCQNQQDFRLNRFCTQCKTENEFVPKSCRCSCGQMLKMKYGVERLTEVRDMITKGSGAQCTVPNCRGLCRTYKAYKAGEVHTISYEDPNTKQQNYLAPEEAYEILKKITKSDAEFLGFDTSNGMLPKHLIIRVLPVIPPIDRPTVVIGGKISNEDDLTTFYSRIIKTNNILRILLWNKLDPEIREDLVAQGFIYEIEQKQLTEANKKDNIDDLKQKLRNLVQHLADNSDHRYKTRGGDDMVTVAGNLNSKTGLVRYNTMSSRVEFSARAPVGPEPWISIDEVRVPKPIADHQTCTETVQVFNIAHLNRDLAEGRIKFITYGNAHIGDKRNKPGMRFQVRADKQKRIKLQPGDVVERNLREGERVIANRQPSLHKQSMMGHKVRYTDPTMLSVGINPAVNPPYNADFDGDEMNLHFPQTEEAKAELPLISVSSCIMNGQNNKNLIGAFYDGIIGLYEMVQEDSKYVNFLTENPGIFLDLLKLIDGFDIADLRRRTEKYSIPWRSGRTIFSAMLPADFEYPYDASTKLYIKEGILLSGQLSSKHIGNAHKSLVQVMWTKYRQNVTTQFINNMNRVAYYYISNFGYSIGPDDCVPQQLPEEPRKNIEILNRRKAELELLIREDQNERRKQVLLQEQQELEDQAQELRLKKRSLERQLQVNNIAVEPGREQITNFRQQKIEKELERVSASLVALENRILQQADVISRYRPEDVERYRKLLEDVELQLRKLETDPRTYQRRLVAESMEELQYIISSTGSETNELVDRKRAEKATLEQIEQTVAKFETTDMQTVGGDNRMMKSIQSGAKGSTVNRRQMSIAVGQQFLTGNRLPIGCVYNNTDPNDLYARGFCSNSYFTGFEPDEYASSQMAGREGLINIAVMVSRGGKKQRDFVKSFEDYQVTYDGSCRDTNNGNIAQYVYGGDGFAANELEKIKTKLGESTTFIVLERVTDAINTKYGF